MDEQARKQVIIDVKTKVDTSEATNELEKFKEKASEISNLPLDKSIQTLKRELREATDEAEKMFKQFGSGSKEFQQAATKVADLRNEVDEVNLAFKNFNPDNKLQSFVGIAQGAVGALQGVAGAMAFVGVESETATETMAKLQGLMAFSDALNSIGDIKDSFKNLGGVIQSTTIFQKANAVATNLAAGAMRILGISATQTGVAFTVLKGIIATTGIGLLIVGISTLITKIIEWTSSEDDLADSIKYANLQLDKQKDLTSDLIAKNDAKIKQQIADAQKAGKSEKELLEIRKAGYAEDARLYRQAANDKLKDLNRIEGVSVKQVNDLKSAQEALNEVKKLEVDTNTDDKAVKGRIDAAKTYLEGIISDYRNANSSLSQIVDDQNSYDVKSAEDHRNKMKQQGDAAAQERKQQLEQRKQELEQERQLIKQHYDEILKITNDAEKELALLKLNDKDKEIQQIENEFQDKLKTETESYTQEKLLLDKHLKNKEITQAEYDKKVQKLTTANNNAVNALVELRGEKELEVTKRYNKEINDFIAEYQETEYQRQRQKLIEDFDAKIAVADEKQKILLKKLKTDQVDKLDTTHNAEVNVTKTETNVIQTTRENQFAVGDDVESMKAKIQNIANAELEAENAAFELKKINAQGNNDELALIEQQHQDKILAIQNKSKDEQHQIDKAVFDNKVELANAVGSAIGALGGLLKKGSAAQKTAAVAEIAINTATGFMNALKIAQESAAATGPGAALAMPIFYASQIAAVLAAVSRAKAALTSSGAEGSNGNTVTAPPAVTAPTINTTLLQQGNQVHDVRVVNQKDAVIRSYISQKDLETEQQKQEFFKRLQGF